MPSLDVISINLWQILISLCNLLILFLILKKFLYKPVRRVMQEDVYKRQISHRSTRADTVTLLKGISISISSKFFIIAFTV